MTSFIVDLADVVINLVVAMLSGSVVMLAETLQGAADLLTSSLLLVGLHRAQRRANKNYRFGQGRELFFWVLIAGVAMFMLTATLSFIFGLERILHPRAIENIWLTYAALTLGLITNAYALSLSVRRLRGASLGPKMWQHFRHSSLIETKATLVLDMLGAVSAGMGLFAIAAAHLTGNSRFDGIGSITIGIATAVLAVVLISSVKDLIVGRSATSDIENRIREGAMEVDEVQRVLDVKTMYLGSERLLVNLDVHMRGGLETRQIEAVIDEIKRRVKRRAPIVSHIQVELETPIIRQG